MSKESEFKIIQKCYEMMLYSEPTLAQFPKSKRHTLVARIETNMLLLLELLLEANKRYYKKTTLQDIDIQLDKVRYLVRLSRDLGYIPFKKYEVWSKMLNELGRMLGGWFKSIKR